MTFDTIIRGGTVATASDTFACDVGISAGKIAALGDMLELGETAPELHKGLADAVTGNGIDLVFACGPLMRSLYDALPSHRRGAYAAQASSLEPYVLDAVRAGDVVTVKGSLGTRMGPIVKAMTARFPVVQADD